jgi:hypothetical protein
MQSDIFPLLFHTKSLSIVPSACLFRLLLLSTLPYNTSAPTNPNPPTTAHIPFAPFPTTCCLLAAPVKVATGAAFVACTEFAENVKLGSELHVAPCATDTVVIVMAGRASVAVELGFDVAGTEVVAALTTLADFTVEELEDDGNGEAKAVEASESDDKGIALGFE